MNDIIYMGNFILPDKNAAAQRVLGNAKLLRSIGYRVILAGASDEGEASAIGQYLDFPSYPCPSGFYKKISSLWSIEHFYRVLEAFPNTSAIILYNYRSISMERIRRACKRRRIVCIADTTEWYEAHGNIVSKLVTAFDVFFRMRIVQPRMNGLIPTSRYLHNYYEKYGKPMIILPTLMDRSEYTSFRYEKDYATATLVFAGSAGLSKDRLDIVIQLLQIVKESDPQINFKFKIIGMTERDYETQFPKQTIPQILRDAVVFYGRLPRKDTLKEIAESNYSIFLRPNNRVCNAGSPTKLAESLACGTPVITNRVGDAELYLVDGTTGWFIDTSDLSQAAVRLSTVLKAPQEVVTQMKAWSKETNVLDYSSYKDAMRAFMKELKL